MRRLILALFAPLFLGCATPERNEAVVVIQHVTVLSMAPGALPQSDVAVLIRGDRIERIVSTHSLRPPMGAQIVDGRGKYLIPGLTDAHAHPENPELIRAFTGNPDLPETSYRAEDVFLPYIAHGVLTVLNMSANADALEQRDEIESGRALGPHLALAFMIDGARPIWPFAAAAATPDEGAALVRRAHADGYDFIKAYSGLDAATFAAIVAEAARLGIPVIGHLPGRGQNDPERFLLPNFRMVAHAEEFAYQAASPQTAEANIGNYAHLMLERGVWLTSTLTLNERIVEQARDPQSLLRRPELPYLNPITRMIWLHGSPYANQPSEFAAHAQEVVVFNERLVRAFAEAGVPILPGTDATIPGVAAGASLHDELEALSRAGLDNQLILESATRRAAEFLGVASDRGTVEAGKRADLVLLDGDPTADITNTRRISAVFVGGRYLSAAWLSDRLDEMAQRYAAP